MIFVVLLTFSAVISHSNAVFQFPESPKFLLRELKSKVTFDCSTGEPDIHSSLWFKIPFPNYKWKKVLPRPGKMKEHKGVFTLMRLTVNDAGFYECRAETNKGDPIRSVPNKKLLFLIKRIHLQVKVIPKRVLYRKLGENGKFICKSNVASAKLKWFKTVERGYNNPVSERPIPSDKNHVIKDLKTSSAHFVELEIKNLTEGDEGLYVCRGRFKDRTDYEYSRVTLV